MVRSEARIATDSADRFAKQLCNHANRMGASSTWTPPEGVIDFPQGGTCHLRAGGDELVLIAEAVAAADLATIQAIVAADLQRFGQRDGMTVTWSA